MSAAAQAAIKPRKVVKGWSRVPNSLIENYATLPAAEFVLSLIVLRADTRNGPAQLTATRWNEITNLKERSLELAIKGLKEKGILDMTGQGNKARFVFKANAWETYLREKAPAQTPTTAGRKERPVKAKPGAMVHPECQHQCMMLKGGDSETESSPLMPIQIAQPVARNSGAKPGEKPQNPGMPQKGLTPATATQTAQPVTRIDKAATAAWGQSLGQIQSFFPWVEMPFVAQLVSVCRSSGFPDVRDTELALAVAHARSRKKNQQVEGLFLLTVPESLRFVRRQAVQSVALQEKQAIREQEMVVVHREGVKTMLERVAEICQQYGGKKFMAVAKQLDRLRQGVNDGVDLEAIQSRMVELDTELIAAAIERMNDQQRAECEAMTVRCLKPYAEKMSDKQLQELRDNFYGRGALNALGIPRLGAFYV